MPLKKGFTRLHGFVLNELESREFRNMERRLRRHVDRGSTLEAQSVLTEIKAFAGDHEMCRQLFETIRRDADARWQRKWGRSWEAELAAEAK